MLCPAILLLAIGLASCGKQDAAGPPSSASTTQSSLATTEPRQDEAKATPARPDWLAEFDKFAGALTLSEDEAARLKTAFETRERVISQWTAEKGEQLKRLERQMQAAAKARDLANIRAAALPAAKVSASVKNPPAAGYLDFERTVEASILTAEQRTAFAAIKKKNPLRSLKVDY